MTDAPERSAEASVRFQLTGERTELLARLEEMGHDFEALVSASAGSNADDEHDPEGSTIAYERSQLGALTDQVRRHLDEVEAALARLDAGHYGQCQSCGQVIGEERLSARPAARFCIECAGRLGR
ncbi:MAG: TraR/DksA C4-type zinc finger protein [Actinomycetota bacterium]|nr:TraR/DksA C4-type zinc finger protein [Actinomycetota bacterium]